MVMVVVLVLLVVSVEVANSRASVWLVLMVIRPLP